MVECVQEQGIILHDEQDFCEECGLMLVNSLQGPTCIHCGLVQGKSYVYHPLFLKTDIPGRKSPRTVQGTSIGKKFSSPVVFGSQIGYFKQELPAKFDRLEKRNNNTQKKCQFQSKICPERSCKGTYVTRTNPRAGCIFIRENIEKGTEN